MRSLLTLTALILVSTSAMANDFRLGSNGKVVTCVDEDEAIIKLSADRKSAQITIRDKNFGKVPVLNVKTDNATWVAYETKAGTLILTDYSYFEDKWQAYFTDCK